ncbi:hypothetical protein MTO96_040239 [Rhipicephalus appendiculatus]
MLVPLPASQKKAQPPPSLLFDSDDEDFEPSPVAGPQAALYNGAPSQRVTPCEKTAIIHCPRQSTMPQQRHRGFQQPLPVLAAESLCLTVTG